MAKTYKVRKIHDMPTKKAYAIFRVADLANVTGPLYADDDDVRPVMANMASADANYYARQLNAGKSLDSVRYERECMRNMMHSGMN